ncbi:hypothetical protein EHM69_10960 [candidate division KSB1 bacterium]|nr:MAG: hypothetical protein EHM69_10960 [candidate division KSB1 bacterium]
MLRPVENQERLNPGEYINRVKQTEKDHGPGGRDFAYAVEEMTREGHKKHQPSPEFGEDTYESAADEEGKKENPKSEDTLEPDSKSRDDRNLDITV